MTLHESSLALQVGRLQVRHAVGLAWLAAAVALLMGPACLGDVEIEGPPPGSGTPTQLEPLEPCELDKVQCNGSWLERCTASSGDGGLGWQKIQDCLTPELCHEEPGRCELPACDFGFLRCNGAAPERCSEDLTAREALEECVNAAHCSVDPSECEAEGKEAPCCLTAPCEAGALRCNDGQMERCRLDQTGRDPVVKCETQGLCSESIGRCQASPEECSCVLPTCDAGQTRCEGATLQRCNADRTAWEFVEDCATTALCGQSLARQPLACEPAKCEVNEYRCAGATLEVCNAEQTGFELVKTCLGGPAFCDSGAGVCSDVPCEVGETRCSGAQVERCKDDQSGFESVAGDDSVCTTPQLCTIQDGSATCLTEACDVNQFVCNGNQLQRCNAGQTGFINVGPACLRADLCSDQRQRCDTCVPNRRECTPDLTSSRTCRPDGNSFGPLTFCPLGCIAATGACQTCSVGQYLCQNGQLSRCNDGFRFTPLNRAADCSGQNRISCSGNTVQTTPCGASGCNPGRNACNECNGQQRRCADTESFEICQAGSFGPPQACGDGLLCAGAGQCVCSPGQAFCEGSTLLVCNAAGSGIEPGARCGGAGGNVLRTCSGGELITNTCTSAALCGAATDSECPLCVDGERGCAEGQPTVCVDGERVPAEPCAAGFSCEGAGLCRCSLGDVRCAAGELVQCSENRQSLEAAPACDGATLRSCAGAVRSDQDCGTAERCSASSGGVCAECLEGELPSCGEDGAVIRCVNGQLLSTPCPEGDLCVPLIGCLSDLLPG